MQILLSVHRSDLHIRKISIRANTICTWSKQCVNFPTFIYAQLDFAVVSKCVHMNIFAYVCKSGHVYRILDSWMHERIFSIEANMVLLKASCTAMNLRQIKVRNPFK